MSDDIEISTEFIDLVTMQDDGSLRVDIKPLKEATDRIHFGHTFYVYKPGEPAHAKLLKMTGIEKPGDCYAFGFKKKDNRVGLEEDSE